MRASEAATLRINDIDRSRSTIHIRQGKGNKDRYVILSPMMLKTLCSYWKQCRPSKKDFLFSSKAMAKYFGKAFLTLLEHANSNDELNLKGGIAGLSDSKTFGQLMFKLRKKSWNVYAKEPFNGAEGGVTYLVQ